MKLNELDIKKIQQYFATQKDIVAVYLYGSFAKGATHPNSDIDFGILFDKKVKDLKRLGQIYLDLGNLELPADPDVRDINLDNSPVFLMNVIKGKLIFSRDEIKLIQFEVHITNIYQDTEYLRKLKYYYMDKSFEEGNYGYRLLNN